MEAEIAKRYQEMKDAPLTWNPVTGGKAAIICFRDSLTTSFGKNADSELFDQIADWMTNGRYYPADAVQFFGPFQDEGRTIKVGDRILQRAPLIAGVCVWSMVEIYVAERRENFCEVGYVTSKKHHGKGIWTATLSIEDEDLLLKVESIASPRSLLFWIGLPFARYLQLRARRRAIEEFGKLVKVENLSSH